MPVLLPVISGRIFIKFDSGHFYENLWINSRFGENRERISYILYVDLITFIVFCIELLLFINFSVSAAQRRLWPPVALQPSAGYGLLWLCSPARAMASCGSAAQRGL
jgi:hypothetical protein